MNQSYIADLMMKKAENSSLLNPLLFPFMSSVSDIIFHGNEFSTEPTSLKHKERLDQITKAWKFKIHQIDGDGNCLFSAVAFSLISNKQSLLKHDSNFFTEQQLETNDQNQLGMMLRELTVKEWKQNADFYQNFLQCSSRSGQIFTEWVLLW